MKSMYLYLTPKNVSTTVYKGLQKDTCVAGCYGLRKKGYSCVNCEEAVAWGKEDGWGQV